MRSSIIVSALVAVLVGFGGSVAIVIAAAQAVGATQAQTSSWVTMFCISIMITSTLLSVMYKKPLITAWSTPGAALIATSSGLSIEQATGAFIFVGVLITLSGLIGPFGRLIERIPASIATAILAGVLFPFILAVTQSVNSDPWFGLPLVLTFIVVRIFSPSWAVICTLALGILMAVGFGRMTPIHQLEVSGLAWVTPTFDPAALISVGLPLFLVTMASQNLPGFAVLRASGYSIQAKPIFLTTGIASILSGFFSAHTTSLAAITASICTSPDAHPDPQKRWMCGPVYSVGYGVLAVFGASLVTLFTSFPAELISIVAGVALIGSFVNSLSTSFWTRDDHLPATIAFVVTASGTSFAGIGSAFWGLIIGLTLLSMNKIAGVRALDPSDKP
ncbi:benzoate/H(+) symporter BenE family transporter [Sulfitobacter sp. 20_GPM-1509m]|uniref:benzoate/H(+) symporter BenE family transporter n=1 Tax=Sulfitobacter sp. 20_GPM-1509m TaxID=1380367 RepID=UPI0009DD1977|nr:benzoate/H(+) symporter BenE family transporter [Sulfitobacter sp. 20_GPM-1509m]